MSILDPIDRSPTAQDGADQVRTTLSNLVLVMQSELGQVRKIVAQHGRSAIADALGNNAAELASVYNTLKTAVNSVTGEADVPELPS